MEHKKGFYTIEDLAKMFAVSRSSIMKWKAEGRITPVRVGNILRFTPQEVDRFIKKHNRDGYPYNKQSKRLSPTKDLGL